MYVTLAEAKTLISRITNIYENDQGVIDDSHLQLVLDEAEGMVNAAIGSRYDIPVTATNSIPFIRAIVIPILRYKTYTQFAETEEIPEGIMEEYKSALKTLDKLAKQVISLPEQSDKTTGRASHIKVKTSGSALGGF